jgi:glycosyltransferase involved in cell wall biosynthesis
MRIALIASPWVAVPPPAYGGSEAVIDGLARGFQAAGHEVVLCATGDSTCPVPRRGALERAVGFGTGAVVPEIRHVLHAYEAVEGFDIVHDHTVTGPVLATRMPWLRVVTTNHGPFTAEVSDIFRAISPRVPIIAVSHAQAARAGDVPVAGVIHHGVDPERFPVGRGDGGYVLFLGRMVAEKGARDAILAARAAGVPIRLAAKVREPAERRYFEERIRPLLGDGVEFLGELGGRRKLELLAGARALVNPIRWPEPFGMVMIEALACGTPVLAYPSGAAPEIVEPGLTGQLVNDGDELVDAIGAVGELDRDACRAAVESRFSVERMAREHLVLFDRLLSDWPVEAADLLSTAAAAR